MITDYIGGEGSAETPKNDYVIYGWPLIKGCRGCSRWSGGESQNAGERREGEKGQYLLEQNQYKYWQNEYQYWQYQYQYWRWKGSRSILTRASVFPWELSSSLIWRPSWTKRSCPIVRYSFLFTVMSGVVIFCFEKEESSLIFWYIGVFYTVCLNDLIGIFRGKHVQTTNTGSQTTDMFHLAIYCI